jgi:polysaccharide export outer membrane protein
MIFDFNKINSISPKQVSNNKIRQILNLPYLILLVTVSISLSSCFSNKRLAYFQNLNDTTFTLANRNFEPLVQKGDILYVGVTSSDPMSAAQFNSANAIVVQNGANAFPVTTVPGILVGEDGLISLPKIGQVKVSGKTTKDISKDINAQLLPFLKDPVVTVRIMNYRITVLGEVSRPGTVTIPNERITVLEGLGLAGDLTPYGNRHNVLVIRDSSGTQKVHRMNLNDNSIFTSKFYYLQPNDVIYVEPGKTRTLASSNVPLLLPSIISGLSFIVLFLNQL